MAPPGALRAEGRPQDETGRRDSNPLLQDGILVLWPGELLPGMVELEGVEPSSTEHGSGLLRPFPSVRLTAADSPGRADHGDPAAGPFPGVSGLCRLSAGLSPPSTAASGAGLQRSGPACHRWSRCHSAGLIGSGGESENVLVGVSWGAPFRESGRTLVATVDPSGLCRNQVSPEESELVCCLLVGGGGGTRTHAMSRRISGL